MTPALTFLQHIQANALVVAERKGNPTNFIEGADLVLLQVQEYLSKQPVFSPAHVGYKKAEARRIQHQAELQVLANKLAHEQEAHAKTKAKLLKTPKAILESRDDNGNELSYEQLVEKLISSQATVKNLNDKISGLKAQLATPKRYPDTPLTLNQQEQLRHLGDIVARMTRYDKGKKALLAAIEKLGEVDFARPLRDFTEEDHVLLYRRASSVYGHFLNILIEEAQERQLETDTH